ncbi:MAG: HAD hydrolase-like protein [Bacteroidales bacterium]|nr:HAD hydrolase-like protein [Bacteroidales bacterium]
MEKKAEAYRKLFSHNKLILWDLDGTLLDTLEDLAAAVNHALELRCLPLHSVAEYRKMVGHGVRNLVKQALEASLAKDASAGQAAEGNYFSGRCPKNQFPSAITSPTLADADIDAALADFKEYYSAHIDVHTRPYKGMQELLTQLQARGVKMAVASNKFQEGTEHLIREFFPDIQFVAILGNRPGLPLKPDPEIVREVLAKATGEGAESKATIAGAEGHPTIAKQDAIMVGDSPTDMRTAANGGIDAVAVSWGYRTEEELSGHQIAHSIEELRRILCFM